MEKLIIGSNGKVAAINSQSGKIIWETNLAKGFFSSTHQQDVSVIEHEGNVFAGCQGHVFCIDSSSGKIKWHNELKGFGYNDVTLSIGGKSVQYVTKVETRHR